MKAIELDPEYVVAHQWYSEFLGVMGRYAEAIDLAKRSDELDYSHPSTLNYLTQAYWFSEMPEEAIESFADVELNDQARITCYILAGDKQKALELLEDLFRRHYLTAPFVLTDSLWGPLSEQPRVVELRRSIGLEP